MKDITVLGIETSCDETSAAIVRNGREVLSNVINTQIKIHEKFGGVVPEIASRKHIEVISTVVEEALKQAKMTFEDIDVICPTYGPGLVGALLVGVGYAKALSYSLNKPLVRSKSYRRTYCSKLYNLQRIRTRVFMLNYFRRTYSLSKNRRLYKIYNTW